MANSFSHNIHVCVTDGDGESMNGARIIHDIRIFIICGHENNVI